MEKAVANQARIKGRATLEAYAFLVERALPFVARFDARQEA